MLHKFVELPFNCEGNIQGCYPQKRHPHIVDGLKEIVLQRQNIISWENSSVFSLTLTRLVRQQIKKSFDCDTVWKWSHPHQTSCTMENYLECFHIYIHKHKNHNIVSSVTNWYAALSRRSWIIWSRVNWSQLTTKPAKSKHEKLLKFHQQKWNCVRKKLSQDKWKSCSMVQMLTHKEMKTCQFAVITWKHKLMLHILSKRCFFLWKIQLFVFLWGVFTSH